MNRRSFFSVVGCFLGSLSLRAKEAATFGDSVRLVKYVDKSLVGMSCRFVGPIPAPSNTNEHYRRGGQLYRVCGDGLCLDVYADEIANI
ncbi:MAG: hypothetical protein IT422_29205 [Pirellulaceae bacterium]|nr:hypothetical protein [Pirellulaceae bacterium]